MWECGGEDSTSSFRNQFCQQLRVVVAVENRVVSGVWKGLAKWYEGRKDPPSSDTEVLGEGRLLETVCCAEVSTCVLRCYFGLKAATKVDFSDQNGRAFQIGWF